MYKGVRLLSVKERRGEERRGELRPKFYNDFNILLKVITSIKGHDSLRAKHSFYSTEVHKN